MKNKFTFPLSDKKLEEAILQVVTDNVANGAFKNVVVFEHDTLNLVINFSKIEEEANEIRKRSGTRE